jgi:hypothetical protein
MQKQEQYLEEEIKQKVKGEKIILYNFNFNLHNIINNAPKQTSKYLN